MRTARRKDYLNPRGEGFVKKTGQTFTNGRFVEIERGVSSGAMLPKDYSCDIIGLISVPDTGLLQQVGEATVEVAHDYRVLASVAEDVQAGDALVWSQTKQKFELWIPLMVDASQTVTLSTNATGGDHTITIDGVALDVTVVNTDTPTQAAVKVVAAINAHKPFLKRGFMASNSSGVITIINKNGASANGTTITVATDDGAQTIVAGGATFTGGVGYPERSIVARAKNNILEDAEGEILIKVRG